jgi:hypothetical protein
MQRPSLPPATTNLTTPTTSNISIISLLYHTTISIRSHSATITNLTHTISNLPIITTIHPNTTNTKPTTTDTHLLPIASHPYTTTNNIIHIINASINILDHIISTTVDIMPQIPIPILHITNINSSTTPQPLNPTLIPNKP